MCFFARFVLVGDGDGVAYVLIDDFGSARWVNRLPAMNAARTVTLARRETDVIKTRAAPKTWFAFLMGMRLVEVNTNLKW